MKKYPRSAYRKVGGLVYFGRMIDKIKLAEAGRLDGYNLGVENWYFFDARCCRFLGVSYDDLVKRVKRGGTDAELLAWCWRKGTRRTDEEIQIWNAFMSKRGWNDEASWGLEAEKEEAGLASDPSIHSFFDLFDREEGRQPKRKKSATVA